MASQCHFPMTGIKMELKEDRENLTFVVQWEKLEGMNCARHVAVERDMHLQWAPRQLILEDVLHVSSLHEFQTIQK